MLEKMKLEMQSVLWFYKCQTGREITFEEDTEVLEVTFELDEFDKLVNIKFPANLASKLLIKLAGESVNHFRNIIMDDFKATLVGRFGDEKINEIIIEMNEMIDLQVEEVDEKINYAFVNSGLGLPY